MEHIRVLINDWAPTLIALFGLIVAWDKAKKNVKSAWRSLNLYGRVHVVESNVAAVVVRISGLDATTGYREQSKDAVDHDKDPGRDRSHDNEQSNRGEEGYDYEREE